MIKVLFVGGYGRSGSTLLDRSLGAIDGFFSAGEIRHAFREGYVENRLCGCGEPFRRCPFWAAVTERAFGRLDTPELARLLRAKQRVDRPARIPQIALGRGGRRWRAELARYLDALRRLYVGIRAQSGARVIVDSSKDVSHGYLLNALGPEIETYVCHLVRDSRGAAHSWRQRKFNPGSGREMDRWGVHRTSAEWSAINALTELQRGFNPRYGLIRYEDFVAAPAPALRELLELVGEPRAELPIRAGNQLAAEPAHTVAGNPIRFRSDPIAIRPDERWRAAMPRRAQALVTALTLPMLARYGYVPKRARAGDRGRRGGARAGDGARRGAARAVAKAE